MQSGQKFSGRHGRAEQRDGIPLTWREENPGGMSYRQLEDKLKVKVGKVLSLSHYTSSCYFSQHIDYKHKHKFLIFFYFKFR